MAQELLRETFVEIDRTPDPARPGVYTVRYDYTVATWDTAAKYVDAFADIYRYVGGYPGAPDEPVNYSRPVAMPVDAYLVPPAGQPGTIAGREGEYTTIYHDGEGDVTRAYAPRCDLRVYNLLGRAPTTAGGTGAVEFDVSTSADWVNVVCFELLGGQQAGSSLAQVAPGRLSLQQLPPGRYYLLVDDARACYTGLSPLLDFVVPAFTAAPPPVVRGCMDEDASNYDPLATLSDGSCVYSPRWSALWAPEGMPVTVVPAAGSAAAFVAGEVYAGYPSTHPFVGFRPQVKVADVRATVSPRTGVAEFNLAPYLRSQVGALQSDGTRRLDANSSAAQQQDLFVFYRLTVGGRTQASGYALNAALSSADLASFPLGAPLSPFATATGATLPVWAGYDYFLSLLATYADGRAAFLALATPQAIDFPAKRLVYLPCPRHALPVAWLAPEGGYGYWVFSGNHSYGDDIAEGQAYTEAGTGELRLSSREGSRRTLEASSGVFSQRVFVEGLRTLRRAVQAWYQPDGPGTAWVPIVLRSGSFPAYREGRHRYEVTIQFSESASIPVQGQ